MSEVKCITSITDAIYITNWLFEGKTVKEITGYINSGSAKHNDNGQMQHNYSGWTIEDTKRVCEYLIQNPLPSVRTGKEYDLIRQAVKDIDINTRM